MTIDGDAHARIAALESQVAALAGALADMVEAYGVPSHSSDAYRAWLRRMDAAYGRARIALEALALEQMIAAGPQPAEGGEGE